MSLSFLKVRSWPLNLRDEAHRTPFNQQLRGQPAKQRSRPQKANLSLRQTALQNASHEKNKGTDNANPSADQFGIFSPAVYMKQKWEAATTQATEDNWRELASLHLTRWLDRDNKLLESFCRAGKAQVVRYVLRKGSNPGTRKKPRPLPLLHAVCGGKPQHYKCVQALLEHGVNLNGHTNLIRDLAAGGANPNIPDTKGELPIHALFKSDTQGSLEKYRLDALACILQADLHGNTEVNTPDPYDLNSPLHLAVSKTCPYAVSMLLYKGANVNTVNSFGLTPLLIAATLWSGQLTSDQEVILDILLKNPANEIDRTSGLLKRTALHWAAVRCSPSAFRLLLDRGADETIKDAEGATPQDMYSLNTQKIRDEERDKINALSDRVEQHKSKSTPVERTQKE
ncbi:ankyrin repeat domain-containing protein [Aspergillus undulatus]|uniref:ankyrin repeat domain-containing protein n=1 Tax=Aspergillus undulatus TaxID=1810928 RepID=UPI003CCD6105